MGLPPARVARRRKSRHTSAKVLMKRATLLLSFALAVACTSNSGTPPDTGSDGGSDVNPGDGGGGGGGGGGGNCTAAREQSLKPIDKVSAGRVLILSETGGTRTLFIDASAGGPALASQNPFIYVNLERAAKVDVTD